MIRSIERWMSSLQNEAKKNNNMSLAMWAYDNGSTLLTIAHKSKTQTKNGISVIIDKLFSCTDGDVIFSSIHKAKGAEWDNVYFIRANYIDIYDYYIDLQLSDDPNVEWILEQESNALYIAKTRARKKLFIYTTNLSDESDLDEDYISKPTNSASSDYNQTPTPRRYYTEGLSGDEEPLKDFDKEED